jgi:hypothetical protein
MKRGFVDLLDPSNDPEFFWQVISGPPCIEDFKSNIKHQVVDNLPSSRFIAQKITEVVKQTCNKTFRKKKLAKFRHQKNYWLNKEIECLVGCIQCLINVAEDSKHQSQEGSSISSGSEVSKINSRVKFY